MTHFGDYQFNIYMQGLGGVRPDLPLNIDALEARAKEVLPPESYWYVAGGASLGETMDANRRAFDRWRIVPRMLRDISQRDHRVEVLGTKMPAPIMIAPIGVQEIVHPEAEIAVARAAKEMGVPMILSTLASNPLEKVAETLGDTPRWFQLYWPKDNEVTKSLLRRAEKAGYGAIVVTLDTRVMGWREYDLQAGYLPFLRAQGLANYLSDPVFREGAGPGLDENPMAAVGHWAGIYSDATHTWDDLKVIAENTTLPVLLKGILHPDDVRRAIDHGVHGIIVSNHGGRQVNGSISALDALPGVADAAGNALPVLFDSGVRCGSDIVKALALGAKAVLIGRPFVWGLAVNGSEGVAEVLRRMLADYDIAMAMSGFSSPKELNREILAKIS